MSRKKLLEANLKKYYFYKIFSVLFFFVPIMVLFWQDNGLSLTQIMLLQSGYSILTLILEVPSGYYADSVGRKKSIIISSFFLVLSITIYSFSTNFWQFLVAEGIFAFSASFLSGADSAFIYDTLVELKREKEYKKIWGNLMSVSLLSMAAGSIIGGFMAKLGFRYTFFLTIPFVILVIPIAFSLKEPKRYKEIFEKNYLKEIWKILKNVIWQNHRLRWLILYSALIFAFNQSALWLYQPYFELSGLDVAYFGIVFASFQFVAAITARYAHRIEETLGEKFSLISLLFLIGISDLLMSNFIFLFSFSFAFIHQFIRSFKNVVIIDYINREIKSSIRATVLSVENFVRRGLYALLIPIVGWIADIYSLRQALTVLGITTLSVAVIILFVFRKYRVI